LPVAIDGVRAELEAWRARRRRGERIPGGVWRSVVRAAQRHGVHRVSRALGLDDVHVKRRVAEAKAHGETECGEGVFVELAGTAVAPGAACVVELEKGNGTRMRICVRDGATVDWCRMKEAFLGA
jgi:hypothetical protein